MVLLTTSGGGHIFYPSKLLVNNKYIWFKTEGVQAKE